jgi:hypothetical protein
MATRRKPQQTALFDNDTPGDGSTPVAALQVQAAASKALSPAAQAFNRALRRIENLQKQHDELERTCLAHQAAWAQSVSPLRTQHTAALQRLTEQLSTYLDQPSTPLSKTQRSTLRDVVCSLAIELLEQGVTGMEALHDRYSAQTLAQKRQEEADTLREGLDQLMGHFGGGEMDLDLDAHQDDPQAMLQAAMEQLRARAAAEAAQHQARTAARKAKKAQRAPTAQQQRAEQALKDADTSLRQIYRQLASALHPDREPDPQERLRKNTLMSEANAAYERKDLVALLRLQLQAELVDPDHLERVSQERLTQLTLLLKQQAADLERNRQMAQQRWTAALELPWGAPLQASFLRQRLQAEVLTWETEVRGVLDDVAMTSEVATLKPWLNEQRKMSKRASREAAIDHPFDAMPW